MIPFSPPFIDQDCIDEVVEVLKSGWITTGPKTKLLEKTISDYVNVKHTLCVNSATAGLELILRWYGVKEGDEVIVPAYTYSATANVVIHCGATPIIVDVNHDDFNISIAEIKKHITPRTKVIIPVDFAGLPCDYDAIYKVIEANKNIFQAESENQKLLGRILLLSDAAHSLGAIYNDKKTGSLADATCFSFHAVKNVTTAEGGAICLNLPEPFDNHEIYARLNTKSLHGQNKDALSKAQKGSWEYDIVEAGYKCNMPDILAALGLAGMSKYESHTLKRRKQIVELYTKRLQGFTWAELPIFKNENSESSYHFFALRIKGIDEKKRNTIIENIFSKDVAVNVHFKPLPLLSFYRNLGYNISDFPIAYHNYEREISLPVYYTLENAQIELVLDAVIESVEKYVAQ